MIAVDVSKWSAPGGVVSREVWRTLKHDYGVGLAIVGAWHGLDENPGCRVSLENALHEGLLIHTYLALNSRPATSSVQATRDIVGEPMWKELGRAWLDCELDGIQVATIQSAISRLEAWRKPSGIYTAYWWWVEHFGNPTTFSECPLWNVVYDYDPDVDFPKRPYGGWTLNQVHGEQYQGTSYVAGIFVDWNYFYDHHVGGHRMDTAEIERQLTKIERRLTRASDVQRASELFKEAAAVIRQDDPQKPISEVTKGQVRFLLGGS